jgi:hypothetical protein
VVPRAVFENAFDAPEQQRWITFRAIELEEDDRHDIERLGKRHDRLERRTLFAAFGRGDPTGTRDDGLRQREMSLQLPASDAVRVLFRFEADVTSHAVYPLGAWTPLRQIGAFSNLFPRESAALLQSPANLIAKVLVGQDRRRSFRAVPVRALTVWANRGVFPTSREPFVTAPVAAARCHDDLHAGHRKTSIAPRPIFAPNAARL